MESMHDNHQEPSIWVRQATTIKGLVIFVLTMLLLIPTSMIESLIFERQGRQQEAVAEVSGKWGRQQNLAGPFLILPYEQTLRNSDGKIIDKVLKHAFYLPDALKINGQVQPELRHRGIFEVVLYSSALSLEGSFGKLQTDQFIPADAQVLWEQAQLALSIPDLRGLKDQVKLDWDAQSSLFDPGIPVSGLAESGIHVPISLQKEANGAHTFKISLALKGSGSLFFTPVGKVTEVAISAPWADPSFSGAFLPEEKQIDGSSFAARWKVLNLNRNYPQQWLSEANTSYAESAFGVDFLLPVDNYQKSTRSVKYAILFISLTFLTIFFIEMRQKTRVHAFQYALIGLALVIFYTLLVSISEHLSFDSAYLIAAIMTIGLTTLYANALFASRQMAFLVGGTLTVLYGFLFVVLQQQDYALLIGSIGLFLILAAVMYFSRKIEW
jgi:inner membrane protein